MFKTCPHLAPLERALGEAGIALDDGAESPYGPEWGIWHYCDCVFDAPSLRKRVGIPDFVTYEEYDGRVAGSDATFYCPQCKRAIMGRHPRYAYPDTLRLG
jgi:hypothetical protein